MLVLTETGGSKNSENFDGSHFPPNSYNGGNTASCVDSGAIPAVKITIAGVTTTYLDNGQVLNGAGVDSGHCLNGKFVSGRMDESHPWSQIGASSPVAPSAPQSLAATAGSGSVSLTWTPPASNGGAPSAARATIYPGHYSGRSGPPVATVTGTKLHRHGPDQRDHLLLQGRRGQRGRGPHRSLARPARRPPPCRPRRRRPRSHWPRARRPPDGQAPRRRAPSSNGGSPVTGYNVYRGTSPGAEGSTPVATNVTTTSFTDTGLTNGTTYYTRSPRSTPSGPRRSPARPRPPRRRQSRPRRRGWWRRLATHRWCCPGRCRTPTAARRSRATTSTGAPPPAARRHTGGHQRSLEQLHRTGLANGTTYELHRQGRRGAPRPGTHRSRVRPRPSPAACW